MTQPASMDPQAVYWNLRGVAELCRLGDVPPECAEQLEQAAEFVRWQSAVVARQAEHGLRVEQRITGLEHLLRQQAESGHED